MKWTVRIELTPDGNKPITYDIGTITRPIADLSPEQIGLTLEEGQQLLRRVQVEMISSQAHAYALCRRPCEDCGRPRRIKDTRTKCVQTVFGAFRFRGRRYRTCACCDHSGEARQDFPLGELIPRRTMPEVRYMFAELGAAVRRQRIIPSLAALVLGHFLAAHADVALGFQRIEQRIERSLPKRKNPGASPVQLGCQLVTIHGPLAEKLQHQRPGASFEELGFVFHNWY